jgi:hypothetical protein
LESYPPEYNKQFLFSFSPDDQNKIMNKDIKCTKHFKGEDKSQPSYSTPDISSIDSFVSYDDNSLAILLKNGQSSSKKPSFHDYMARFGEEHAKTWLKYTPWKKSLKKEKTGTIRPLHPEETAYFEYAKQYYEFLPTLRSGKHKFHNPPSTWISRYLHLKQPTRYKEIIDCLVQFVKNCKECSKSERSNWNQVLEPLPLGSLERILWATAFLKSTNGVAGKVSCGHFRELVKNAPTLTLGLHQKPYLIAAML